MDKQSKINKMKKSLYILSFLLTGWIASNAGNVFMTKLSVDPTVVNNSFQSSISVDLLFFNYTTENSKVILKWATVSETNTDYYTIERSIDGSTFSTVTSHKGSINSNSVVNYQATDENPLAGSSYYRLKKTKVDGKSEYMGTIICQVSLKNEYSFKFTNPVVNDKLEINVTGESGNLKIGIYNYIGQKIIDKSVYFDNNNSTLSIPFNNLQKGYYIMTITTPSGRIYSFPLAKV